MKTLILIICLTLPAFVYAQKTAGEPAPAVSLKDLTGKIVKIQDFKGKVVVLNFWATW
jgi:thiol-disulfide isomerase/thioredoxin